jgi:hypothetical protein
LESTETRGSRYLHAVYKPERDVLIHMDGAIRIYSQEDWRKRRSSHVRKAGKSGIRVKVFRIDCEVTRETLSLLCPQFFRVEQRRRSLFWSTITGRYMMRREAVC